MPTAVILLIIIGALIYLGLAQRVLDHLYLTDNQAILIIIGMIIGSFFDMPILQQPPIYINIGGALIPFLVAIYILVKIDTSSEIIRTISAVIATTGVIYITSQVFRFFGEGRDIIDPMYIFALSGGVFGYLFGRSRRGAFIAGTLGFLFYNLINVWRSLTGRIITQVFIGGGGIFDNIVIAGFVGLLLAEFVGELRESMVN